MKHPTPKAPMRRLIEIMSGNVTSKEALKIGGSVMKMVIARMKSAVEEIQNMRVVVGCEEKKTEGETWRDAGGCFGCGFCPKLAPINAPKANVTC